MTNPVFSNSPVFGDPRQQRGRQQGGVQQAPAWGTPGAQTADAVTLEQMYDAPTATPRDTGRLTYDDVIVKTGGLLALLVVVAAATWNLAPGLWPGVGRTARSSPSVWRGETVARTSRCRTVASRAAA